MEVHPLLSCLSVNISSNVETVFGSVLCEAICLLCPVSSSNSMLMLHPRMPQASSSLFTNISTPILWRSSQGNRTSVHDSKWRCLASRRVVVNISATCWIASSLNVGSWKKSSSSMGVDGSCFVLFGGVSVAGVQLEPDQIKKKFIVKTLPEFELTIFNFESRNGFHPFVRFTSTTSPPCYTAPSAGFSETSTANPKH